VSIGSSYSPQGSAEFHVRNNLTAKIVLVTPFALACSMCVRRLPVAQVRHSRVIHAAEPCQILFITHTDCRLIILPIPFTPAAIGVSFQRLSSCEFDNCLRDALSIGVRDPPSDRDAKVRPVELFAFR
jgi:hypothetical protein